MHRKKEKGRETKLNLKVMRKRKITEKKGGLKKQTTPVG